MDTDSSKRIHARQLRWAPWTCIVISLLNNLGLRLIQVPLLRILELGLCRRYYSIHDPSVIDSNGNVDEHLCKIDSVQEGVAYIIGLLGTITMICELVEVVPFGVLSDKYGRKLFLSLHALSTTTSAAWIIAVGYFHRVLPVESVLALPVLTLMSGGTAVATVNTLALVGDCVRDEYQRTRILAYLNATGQVLLLLGPVIASSTMFIDLLVPVWICFGVYLASGVVVALLPDTRKLAPARSVVTEVSPGPMEQDALLHQGREDSQSGGADITSTSVLQAIWRTLLVESRDMWRLSTASRNLRWCLVVLLVSRVGPVSTDVMVQYISIRYNWTFAQAGYMLSVKAAVSLANFLIIIPFGLKYLTENRGVSKPGANLIGLRASTVFLVLGALAISLSVKFWIFIPAMMVFILGFGLALYIQSLLISPQFSNVDHKHHGRLYSLAGLVEAVGMLIAVPALTMTWAAAIKIGGIALGLPFFICAVSYFAVGFVVYNLRV